MFTSGCEHLISHGLTTVLTDDEYRLVAFYIAELHAILKVPTTHGNAVNDNGKQRVDVA